MRRSMLYTPAPPFSSSRSRSRSGLSGSSLSYFFLLSTASGIDVSRVTPPNGWATWIRRSSSPRRPEGSPALLVPALSFSALRAAIKRSQTEFRTAMTPSRVLQESSSISTSPDLSIPWSCSCVSGSSCSGRIRSILLTTIEINLLANRGLMLLKRAICEATE